MWNSGRRRGPVRDEPFGCRYWLRTQTLSSRMHAATWPASLLSAAFVIPLHTSLTLFCRRLSFILSPRRFVQLQSLRLGSPVRDSVTSGILFKPALPAGRGSLFSSVQRSTYFCPNCCFCSLQLIFASGNISLCAGSCVLLKTELILKTE